MSVMYWIVYLTCSGIAKKLYYNSTFINNKIWYIGYGIILLLVGFSGLYINYRKDYTENLKVIPLIIFGIFWIFISLLIDVKMIIDAFSGTGILESNIE